MTSRGMAAGSTVSTGKFVSVLMTASSNPSGAGDGATGTRLKLQFPGSFQLLLTSPSHRLSAAGAFRPTLDMPAAIAAANNAFRFCILRLHSAFELKCTDFLRVAKIKL